MYYVDEAILEVLNNIRKNNVESDKQALIIFMENMPIAVGQFLK